MDNSAAWIERSMESALVRIICTNHAVFDQSDVTYVRFNSKHSEEILWRKGKHRLIRWDCMPLELRSPPTHGHSPVFISHRIVASSSFSPSEAEVTTLLHVCVSTPVLSV